MLVILVFSFTARVILMKCSFRIFFLNRLLLVINAYNLMLFSIDFMYVCYFSFQVN